MSLGRLTITRLLASVLFALALAGTPGPAHAATDPSGRTRYYVPPMPADISQVEVFLLTVGLGDDLASRFGHTGLRVRDPVGRTDVVFNWGKFSFDEPGFGWKFFRGSLVYSMGVRTIKAELERQTEDGRRVVQERLNLTTAQKLELMKRVAENAKPENRDFAYQYWFSNCATVPRDHLNTVLAGALERRFAAETLPVRFRDYVRSHLAAIPFAVPLLDVLMNGNIDRPITAWEEMFLPSKLREHLVAMPSIDDQGRPVPGTALLVESEVLVDKPESLGRLLPDHALAVLPTWVPLLLALFLLARRRPPSPATLRAVGAATLAYGLLAGVLGATLLLNWGFSGHPDGWHNANLLLCFPTDLLLVPLGLRIFRTRAPVKDRWPWPHATRIFAALHVVGLIALVALTASGVLRQDVTPVLFWGAPTMLAAFAVLTTLGLAPAPGRPRRASNGVKALGADGPSARNKRFSS